MAFKFLNHIDLTGHEVQNALLHNTASTPSTGAGSIWFDTGLSRPKLKLDGSTVRQLALLNADGQGGLVANNMSLANGKLFLGGSSGLATEVLPSAIPLSAFGAPVSTVDFGGVGITGLPDPADDTAPATRGWVNTHAQGFNPKPPVVLATVAALPAFTFSSNTITASANGALVIDGSSPIVGDRVLLKDNAQYNGIYTVSAVGSVGAPFVLVRATDNDTAGEMSFASTFVTSGTVNARTSWACNTSSITLNTTPLVWVQTFAAGNYTAGRGIVFNGSVVNFARNSDYVTGELFFAHGTQTLGSTGHPGSANKVVVSLTSPNAIGFSAYDIPASATANRYLVFNGAGTAMSVLTSVNNSICTINGSGVPTAATTLPDGTTYGSGAVAIYRAGGTKVSLTDGGTNADLLSAGASGGLVYKASGTALGISAAGTSGQFFRSGGSGAPTTYDLFASANVWTETNTHQHSTTGKVLSAYKVTTDAQDRLEFTAQGGILFGTGTVAPAVELRAEVAGYISVLNGSLRIKPSAGVAQSLAFFADNGTQSIQLQAPNGVVANRVWYLPHNDVSGGVWQSDGSGNLTCATVPAASVTGAALTKTDDTNVTLTLTGTPATALLRATQIAVGWSGTLSVLRGGTGAASFTANGVLYGSGTNALGVLPVAAADTVFTGTGSTPSFSANPSFGVGIVTKGQAGVALQPYGVATGNTGEVRFLELAANGVNYVALKSPDAISLNKSWVLPVADVAGGVWKSDGAGNLSCAALSASEIGARGNLSLGNDTNVQLSVSAGSGTGLVFANATITASWAGQLGLSRGGTNNNLTAVNGGIVYSDATKLNVTAAGTTGQLVRSGGAGAPTWTGYSLPASITAANSLLLSGSATSFNELAVVNDRILTSFGGTVGWGGVLNPANGIIGIARKFCALIQGNGTNKITVTHGLNTRNFTHSLRLSSSGDATFPQAFVSTDVEVNAASPSEVDLIFGAPFPTSGEFFVLTVIG